MLGCDWWCLVVLNDALCYLALLCCLMVPGTAWRCLVVFGCSGGAWWCMAVQCVWCVLFGAAWRGLVAIGGAWWCLVVPCDWFMLRGGAWRCLGVLGGAWWCLVVLGTAQRCLALLVGVRWCRCFLVLLGGA